jgi:hypothetical protein
MSLRSSRRGRTVLQFGRAGTGLVQILARTTGAGVPISGGALKPKFFVIVSLSCGLLAGPCYGEQRRSTTNQPAQQTQPAPTLPPPTLAQQPASPPQVSFQGGQLTISAQNSTLGDILKAVRTQTGAEIEVPGNAPERVVGSFGPAPARDVLTSLLNGTHFNYLLLGSSTDPGALDRVILMAKSGGSAENSPPPVEQASASNQSPYARPTPVATPMAAPPGGNTVVVEGQDAQDDSADDSTDSTDDDTSADDQTDQSDQGDDQAAAADDQQQQQQQDVKTPEQLLQELQQRQQQLQQGIQPGVPPGVAPGHPFPNPGVPGLPGVDGTQPAPPPHN